MAEVLIIDDDKGMNLMLVDLITSIGHGAESAFTRAQGLEKTESGNFDVVFLDVMLPDGSGLDIIKDLRTPAPFPEIIIMTGVGDPNGAETAIKSEVNPDLFSKIAENCKKLFIPVS